MQLSKRTCDAVCAYGRSADYAVLSGIRNLKNIKATVLTINVKNLLLQSAENKLIVICRIETACDIHITPYINSSRTRITFRKITACKIKIAVYGELVIWILHIHIMVVISIFKSKIIADKFTFVKVKITSVGNNNVSVNNKSISI